MISLLSELHADLFSDISNNQNTETESMDPDTATITFVNGFNFVTFLPLTVNHTVQIKVKDFIQSEHSFW
jgi:hypothetical protein